MKVSLIQMNSREDKRENLGQARDLMDRAVRSDRPDMIVLPEMFTCLANEDAARRKGAERLPDGEAWTMLRDFARTHEVIIHGGSILEIGADEKIYNTSCAFGRDGTELARYRKIHLFDVETPDGKSYRESDTFSGGSEIITYRADDHVVGCSICYDLRFPELYQALAARAAEIIVVPAAFTMQTGKDHWEVLLRARAIETETYVLAAAQCGSYANGTRVSYGQSLMVDPWGHVIARRNDRPGIVTAQIDFDYLKEVRGMIPLRNHKRLKTSHSVGER